jgi:hypothetical protein
MTGLWPSSGFPDPPGTGKYQCGVKEGTAWMRGLIVSRKTSRTYALFECLFGIDSENKATIIKSSGC